MLPLFKKLIPEKVKRYVHHQRQKKEQREYAGDAVFCPVCGSSFRAFAPFGVRQRENARCLKCDSRERHRLIYTYLKNEKKLFDAVRPLKVLHFAPESIFYEILSRAQNVEYFPCDLFPEFYIQKVQKMDITDIKFPDNTFDVILCNHVLEHIPNDRTAMAELFRVMKPGGWGIFQVPIDYTREKTYEDFSITSPAEREKAFGQHDHVRWYGRDYKDRLASVSFKVNEDPFVKRFSTEETHRFGFNPEEFIYLCEKPY